MILNYIQLSSIKLYKVKLGSVFLMLDKWANVCVLFMNLQVSDVTYFICFEPFGKFQISPIKNNKVLVKLAL